MRISNWDTMPESILSIIINSKEFLGTPKKNQNVFTRNRKMPFSKLIKFMLTRVKGSTQNALEKFFDKLGGDTFMTQQAFSEARLKVKDTAFSILFCMTAQLPYTGYYDTWRVYRVMAIDGSKIALPDIDLLGHIYGTMEADSLSPTTQASICYDILNKVVVDALIRSKNAGIKCGLKRLLRIIPTILDFGEKAVLYNRIRFRTYPTITKRVKMPHG